jgi:hypothetical protein
MFRGPIGMEAGLLRANRSSMGFRGFNSTNLKPRRTADGFATAGDRRALNLSGSTPSCPTFP